MSSAVAAVCGRDFGSCRFAGPAFLGQKTQKTYQVSEGTVGHAASPVGVRPQASISPPEAVRISELFRFTALNRPKKTAPAVQKARPPAPAGDNPPSTRRRFHEGPV